MLATNLLRVIQSTSSQEVSGIISDSYFQYYTPSEAYAVYLNDVYVAESRDRWGGESALTIGADGNNPYAPIGRTLDWDLTEGTSLGRRIYADEAGFSPGEDVISAAWVMEASEGTYRISLRFENWNGDAISTTNGSNISMDGTVKTVSIENISIPQNAYRIRVDLVWVSGTDNPHIYALYGNAGEALQSPTPVASDPNPATTESLFSDYTPTIGNANLTNWYTALDNSGSNTAVINVIGDSWAGRNSLTYDKIRADLIESYGDGGFGYVPVIGNRQNVVGITSSYDSGNWTNVGPDSGGEGPDGSHVESSTDTAWHEVTCTATDVVIHYINQPGGGVLRYQVDGAGDWININTDDTAGHDTVTISGLSDAQHTVRIEVVGTDPCKLCGTEWRRGTTGVRVNNCGYGGSTTAEWGNLNMTYIQSHIASMGADLVLIMMGGNGDESEWITMYDDTKLIIDAAQAAGANVVLCTPGPKSASEKFVPGWIFRQLQQDENTGLVDYGLLLRPWSDADANYFSDGLHLSSEGAEYVGDYLLNGLLFGAIPAPSDVEATAAGTDQINLEWIDNSSGTASFSINRSPDGSTDWTEIDTVPSGTTTYSDTNLTQETAYYYRIRAFENESYSVYSAVVNTTTGSIAPDAPTLLSASAVSDTQIDLDWTDNSSLEDGFKVERSPNGTDGWSQIGTTASNENTYSDTELEPETTYYYRVRAYNGSENSSYSSVANATTEEASGFIPTDVSNLQLWIDATSLSSLYQDDAGSTPVAVDGDIVGQWQDKSGNSRHLTQSDATRKPLYKTNIINGKAVIRADGINDFLQVDWTETQPITIIAVIQQQAFGNNDAIWDGATNLSFLLQQRDLAYQVRMYAGTLLGNATLSSNPHIVSAIYNGASSAIYSEGGTADLSGNAGNGGFSGLTLMANGNRNGNGACSVDIAEFCVYDKVLTSEEHNNIGQYLADKWGLTWTNI